MNLIGNDERTGPGNEGPDRRTFLKVLQSSLWAGVGAGCSYQPRESLVPYVREPDGFPAGRSIFYATAVPDQQIGVLVESQGGRPTKVEGNPDHPGSLGHTDVFSQASLLDLYDPDRSQIVLERGAPSSWPRFVDALRGAMDRERAEQGRGLRLLTGRVTSPTMERQLHEVLAALPMARWVVHDPLDAGDVSAGARMAYGAPIATAYRFDRAARVLSLGSDFLNAAGGAHLRYAHDYAQARRTDAERRSLGIDSPLGADVVRLYVVESTPTQTGAKADHVLRVRPSSLVALARAFAQAVGVAGLAAADGPHGRWVDVVAEDLRQHAGRSIVVAGDGAGPHVHALAHAMNHALGNIGTTVLLIAPENAAGVEPASIESLADEMRAGSVRTLVVIGTNPAYTAPRRLGFTAALDRVPFRAHHGLYVDETGERCHWHVPATHYLEQWSDVRTFDGTASVVQPLIFPLYNGKSAHELLGQMTTAAVEDYEAVRTTFAQLMRATGVNEDDWRTALRVGVIAGSAWPPTRAALAADLAAVASESAGASRPQTTTAGAFDVIVRPDPTILDGRYANNRWLQEAPKPLTTITWENVIAMSPATAARLGVAVHDTFTGGGHESDVVRLTVADTSVEGPVWILPGQPDDTVTVHLGYGRPRAGSIGTGLGFDAYGLRRSGTAWFTTGAAAERTGRRQTLASTQVHFAMEQREPVRILRLDDLQPAPGDDAAEDHATLYPEHRYPYSRWGMAIDNEACVGCNACVIACQAENNVPTVGKAQVLRSREMHWLRIDTYHDEAGDGPFFQPLMCVHCEKAPCEPPCPVHATVHDAEGLNVMVYNRCIGTRYCSNNCPYKVRRFNFLLYQDWETESLKMLRNPEVTVRSRGVMEKCTYCTQRIQAARIDASREDRPLRDGDVKTACQAVCPTDAIVFGDLNDPDALVTRLRAASARRYALLGEINTQPRTHHLAALRNPNPALATAAPSSGGPAHG